MTEIDSPRAGEGVIVRYALGAWEVHTRVEDWCVYFLLGPRWWAGSLFHEAHSREDEPRHPPSHPPGAPVAHDHDKEA